MRSASGAPARFARSRRFRAARAAWTGARSPRGPESRSIWSALLAKTCGWSGSSNGVRRGTSALGQAQRPRDAHEVAGLHGRGRSVVPATARTTGASNASGRPSHVALWTSSFVRTSEPLGDHGASTRPTISTSAPPASGSLALDSESARRAEAAVRADGSSQRVRAET